MSKHYFDEDEEIYCVNCGKELSRSEIFSENGLCTECARKKRESKARRRQRQKDYSEFELEGEEE